MDISISNVQSIELSNIKTSTSGNTAYRVITITTDKEEIEIALYAKGDDEDAVKVAI